MTQTAAGNAEITARALAAIIRERNFPPTPATVEALWSEIATADTYGGTMRLFVWWVREVEKDRKGTADYWFKRITRRTLKLCKQVA
jgi:hypothetical protein